MNKLLGKFFGKSPITTTAGVIPADAGIQAFERCDLSYRSISLQLSPSRTRGSSIPRVCEDSEAFQLRKAFLVKDLDSSVRWNDASVGKSVRKNFINFRFFLLPFNLLLVLAMGFLTLQAIASSQDLQQLTQKLNSIQTLQSKFVQINPDGQILQGNFYLQKPGKMRFAYSGPADFMLLADGKYLIYHDLQMNEATYLDLDKNPLSILLKDYPDFSKIKDVQIKNMAKQGGKTAVEVFYPQENTTVILHFNEQLILEGWVTHDPQGTIVHVQLQDVVINKPIANGQKLFSFDRPKRARVKRDRGN